jgi:hypothetical protein
MPKARLIPITTIVQAVSEMTDGAASIPELLDALHGRYECDTMMVYDGTSYGLAEAIDGNILDEYGGFDKRGDLLCELSSCQYWLKSATISLSKFIAVLPHEILMTKPQGLKLAMKLFEFFEPDQTFDYDHFNTLTDKEKNLSPAVDDPKIKAVKELDPLDFSVVPDAANTSFKAAYELEMTTAIQSRPDDVIDAATERWLDDKPMATRERNTLLKLVIGMAVKGYTHDPVAKKSTAPKEIADDLAELGISIDPDTVRKYLKEAANTVLPAKVRQP